MNLGKNFIDWVKLLYKNAISCVINNGFSTPWFDVSRGVRQGDPLSAYLFNLVIEVVACRIRADPSVEGISIYGCKRKLSMYADDLTGLVKDENSAKSLLDILDHFKLCSGLEVSKKKTKAMWMGASRHRIDEPLEVLWPRGPIYALGTYFSYNQEDCDKLNFDYHLKAMEKLLNVWRIRDLTTIGRIVLVKTLGISKLIYNCTVLPVPAGFSEKVNGYIFKFIWDEKKPKVKMKTVIGKKDQGGLTMVDFSIKCKALKASWIKRFEKSESCSYMLSQWGGKLLFQCNYDITCLDLSNLPLFYCQVLQAWQSIVQSVPKSKDDISKQIIWNNRFILVGRKSVLYNRWCQAGILKICDVMSSDGNFLTLGELAQKHEIIFTPVDMLRYSSLKSAIPNVWKNTVKKDQLGDSVENTIASQAFSCKQLYDIYLKQIFEPPTGQDELLSVLENENNLEKVYLLPFTCTKNVKLQYFQYKIIHRFLPTNCYLKKIKVTDSDKCPFCNNKQNLNHLFVDCVYVISYWNEFCSWWLKTFSEHIVLTKTDIMYGKVNKQKMNKYLNQCLLHAKYAIFKNVSSNTKPIFCDTIFCY